MIGYNSWDIAFGGVGILISPSTNFSAPGTHAVDFWLFQYNGGIAHDSISVYVNTIAGLTGATFIHGFVPNLSSASRVGWNHYILPIPATFNGATNYLIFVGRSAYGYDMFMDDILIENVPPKPCTGIPTTPLISHGASDTITACYGMPLTINATDPTYRSTTGISYQWQSGTAGASGPFTNIAGDTSLHHTDSALASHWYRIATICENSSLIAYSLPVYLNVLPITYPVVHITASPSDTVVPGQPIVFSLVQTGGGAMPAFQWMKNGAAIPFETAATYTALPGSLVAGDLVSVQMSSSDSCPSPRTVLSDTIVLRAGPLGLGGYAPDSQLSVYPNPTGGDFTISGFGITGMPVRIDVLSALGNLVFHSEIKVAKAAPGLHFSLPGGMTAGHYLLRVSTSEGMQRMVPLTLQR